MAKYVLAYIGGRTVDTPEQQEKSLAAWGEFLGDLGESLVDAGNPFGPSTAVGATDGSVKSGLNGYSIITAGSLDEAADKAKGAPVVANGGAVDVYEVHEVM